MFHDMNDAKQKTVTFIPKENVCESKKRKTLNHFGFVAG